MVSNRAAQNKLQLLHSEKLGKLAWLAHAFSTRLGGTSRVYGGNALNLGFTKHDSRAAVERNRELFLTGLQGSVNLTQLLIHLFLNPEQILCFEMNQIFELMLGLPIQQIRERKS